MTMLSYRRLDRRTEAALRFPRCSVGLLVGTWLLFSVSGSAKAAAPLNEIEKQLLDLYQTTKAAADGSDIVTAGSVLVLQKDHLLMNSVEVVVPTPNVYKGGSIQGLSAAVKLVKIVSSLSWINPLANDPNLKKAKDAAEATREFVGGEKFWVTKIDTRPDGVTFSLLSDPIDNKRYHATLQFPLAGSSTSTPDDVAGLVSEVLKIDAGDNSEGQRAASNQTEQPAIPAVAAPKTVSLGQSGDEVIVALGVPAKIVQLGPKEIDIYGDMKITFLRNRVVDVN